MPKHVHYTVAVVMNMSTSKALQLLNEISARLFFKPQEKAKLRYTKEHLGSEEKFTSSVCFTDLETANHYIASQNII